MVKLEITEDQVRLIQKALDMYSRIGIGQFHELLDHPTYEKDIFNRFAPQKEFEVGDKCMQGTITKIDGDNIYLEGNFGGDKEEQVLNVDKVQFSPDWEKYHEYKDYLKSSLNILSEVMHSKMPKGENASFGIHNKHVDDSCRLAFDIVQVIRNTFYKHRGDTSSTVDSSVHFTSDSGESGKIKCEIV